ncbi:MAG TPA: class I SAM-dependent methyltransferase [Patescibacteria group bacterium]|nr:class I SAM-dependent methyltransferase [Patescibacteria group bacterium]
MQDPKIQANKEWWEKMVAEDNGFTRPWLDLDPDIVRQYADGKLKNPPKPLDQMFPVSILTNVEGKDILCLASGGGQQSAVFGLLGANVTVVDIAEGQLEGDKRAAEHYGYRIKTIQSDMGDLSMLKSDSFDLVFQAPSMAYVPDVRKVYSEVARVLKSKGLYRIDAENPLSQFIEHDTAWDGKGYRITVPYSVKEKKREGKEVTEFRHYMEEIFNGLIENRFTIEHVEESPSYNELYGDGQQPEPGSWLHLELYIHGAFFILARKK